MKVPRYLIVDKLNEVIDKLDNGQSSSDVELLKSDMNDAVDDLRTLRDDIDEWCS